MDYKKFIFDPQIDAVRIAIMIAMTQTQEMEKELMQEYRKMGVRCAATMLSGSDISGRTKFVRSIVGMCLSEKIIERKPQHVHPVAHATHEAATTSRIAGPSAMDGQEYCFKAVAVRYKCWFALCFYGNYGMHEVSSHKTIGSGVQTLGD